MLGGLSFFDAVCHSFATVASGGFSTRNASVGAFQSSVIEWVVVALMFLAGTNFALHYATLRGNLRTGRTANFVSLSFWLWWQRHL